MTNLKALYEEDTVAWAENQAAALRAAAQGGSNQVLDWENLAEEIEDLARSQRRELRSQVRRIVEHLIKLEHSPAIDPRAGWRESIRDARDKIEDVLKESPSLQSELPKIIQDETKRGARRAIASLDDHGELAGTKRRRLTAKSYVERISYPADQVLGDWFPPAPGEPPPASEQP